MTDRPQILQTKEETHGDFKINARVSVGLKAVIANNYSGDSRVTINECLDLICTKLARITAGNALAAEHWEDIIGYCQLALEECARHEDVSLNTTTEADLLAGIEGLTPPRAPTPGELKARAAREARGAPIDKLEW
jgi:hypothetical protein